MVGQPAPGESVFGYEGFGPTLLDLLLDGGTADWQGAAFNGDHSYTADRGPGERPRVDLLGWTATCSNGATPTISIQLVPRDSTAWYVSTPGTGITEPQKFPRGGVFLNAVPYGSFTDMFDLYSGYEPFDLWVPLDRGNVHTWADASVPRS